MRKIIIVAASLALSVVAAAVFKSDALARQQTRHPQQMSYEEAWHVCKKFVDDARLSWDAHGQRYTRGGACMYMLGYRM
jgi:hypothetical protein